jgi:hypothetical protein
MFYTAETQGRNDVIEDDAAFNATVYEEVHRSNNKLSSESVIQ